MEPSPFGLMVSSAHDWVLRISVSPGRRKEGESWGLHEGQGQEGRGRGTAERPTELPLEPSSAGPGARHLQAGESLQAPPPDLLLQTWVCFLETSTSSEAGNPGVISNPTPAPSLCVWSVHQCPPHPSLPGLCHPSTRPPTSLLQGDSSFLPTLPVSLSCFPSLCFTL